MARAAGVASVAAVALLASVADAARGAGLSAAAAGVAAVEAPTAVAPTPTAAMPDVSMGITSEAGLSSWLAAGGRGLDTAYIYPKADQVAVGDAIRSSGVPRSELFVTTKVPCCPCLEHGLPWSKTSPELQLWCDLVYGRTTVAEGFAKDMERLGDIGGYVDLLLLHWPCRNDEETLATWRGLEALLDSGVAKRIGVSNAASSVVSMLLANATHKPSVNQCAYSIGNTRAHAEVGSDEATVALCAYNGVQYEAYSPLGGYSKVDVLSNPSVLKVAAAHNVSTAQVALRWLTQQGIKAVTASDNPEHQKGDLALDFNLTDAEIADLAKL